MLHQEKFGIFVRLVHHAVLLAEVQDQVHNAVVMLITKTVHSVCVPWVHVVAWVEQWKYCIVVYTVDIKQKDVLIQEHVFVTADKTIVLLAVVQPAERLISMLNQLIMVDLIDIQV